MKKLRRILMSIAVAAAVSGCGQKLDAGEIYDQASAKSQEMTDASMSTRVDMTMKQGEDSLTITSEMEIKTKGMNTDSMEYYAEGTTTTLGQSQDVAMYYKDGYYYIDTAGQKIKYAMDIEALTEEVRKNTEGAVADSSYMTEITAEKDGENTVLTFTCDAALLDEYVQNAMSGMGAMGLGDVSYTVTGASGQATVNADGYFIDTDMVMTMEMTANGETLVMDMDTSMVYHDPGQAVEIAVPDLTGYTEIDLSAFAGLNGAEAEQGQEN